MNSGGFLAARALPPSPASRTVGRCEIVREIGRGGMATVYLARQEGLERQVAVKELRGLGTLDPGHSRRFLREARLTGSLSHPNIVMVHDYFDHHGAPYIAMEYLARGSLRRVVGDLTLAQVGGVLQGLLAGLAHVERHGIVHRDIKPENLLVSYEGDIKIADFGIARPTHSPNGVDHAGVESTLGTPNYVSPEQVMAGRLGPWTDLYSVGMTAFEMLVGRTPFGDTKEPVELVLRQVNEQPPRVSDLVPDVHPSVSDWVGWLVSKSPAERPDSASRAWDALEDVLATLLGPRWRRQAALPSTPDPSAVDVPRAVPGPAPALVARVPKPRSSLEPLEPTVPWSTTTAGRPAGVHRLVTAASQNAG